MVAAPDFTSTVDSSMPDLAGNGNVAIAEAVPPTAYADGPPISLCSAGGI